MPASSGKLTSFQALAIGAEFGGSLAGAALLGYFYDRWQGTQPWGAMIGAGLGLVSGCWGVYRQMRRYQRRTERDALGDRR